MRVLRVAVAALLLALAAAATIRADAATPIGTWLDDSKRIMVEIDRCGAALCGKIVWFRWPDDAMGLPLVDLKNPDPALRARPLLGLRVLDGLRPRTEREWEGGVLYNPDDGVVYHVGITVRDDASLVVRAYLLLPIFGKTFVWSRVR